MTTERMADNTETSALNSKFVISTGGQMISILQ